MIRLTPSRLLILTLALAVAAPISNAALPAPDADDGEIQLPPGFRALVVADNLVVGRKVGKNNDALRFLAVASNGDVYGKTVRGGILALRDTDGDGRLDLKQEFGSGGGTGIALHNGWLYHSTNNAVYRYKLTPGELVPTGEQECVVSGLPDEFNTHDAKAFTFDGEGRLLVEVGSPYNAYSDGDRALGAKGKDATEFLKTHGGFWRFDPNKLNQTLADGFHFSTGHRHSLAIAWHPVAREYFMAQMGRDQMNTIAPAYYDDLDNAERVAEEFHLLREGTNLGWPYTYYDPIKKARMVAPEFGGDNQKRAESGKYAEPVIAFPGHWAPLQMTVYNGTQFPEKYRNGIFIAFHGSWNRAPREQAGYKVAFVPFTPEGVATGSYEAFADNFAHQYGFTRPNQARWRPGGVAVGPDGSLYISDTDKGRIWRVIYTGETKPAAINPASATSAASTSIAVNAPAAKTSASATASPSSAGAASTVAATSSAAPITPPAAVNKRGQMLYNQNCASCHMADGSGVPNFQPSLLSNAVVTGDVNRLVRVILHGPAAALPADRPKFSNAMPGFAMGLNDKQAADLVSYIRQAFGENASAITPQQVRAAR